MTFMNMAATKTTLTLIFGLMWMRGIAGSSAVDLNRSSR
jgi:hypothetical protein